MKTYHEMTESVLQRAQAEAVAQKRRRRNSIAITTSGVCLVLLLTILGVGLKQTPAVVPTLPSEMLMNPADTTGTSKPDEQQVAVKVTYLTNVEDQVSQELMSANVSMPLSAMIRVRDTRGLSEEEFYKAREEEIALAEEMRVSELGAMTVWEYGGAVTTIVSNGFLTLDFSDFTAVKCINIETTDMGTVNKGGRPNGTGSRLVDLDWSISSELAFAIENDPTIPLESIRDTVTITINYADETTETLIFDITVNEEGQIFVTQRGIQNFTA